MAISTLLAAAAVGLMPGGQLNQTQVSDAKAAAGSTAAVGTSMLADLHKADPEDNICVSPFSITMAGSMLRAGAGPEAESALAKLLFQTANGPTTHTRMGALNQALKPFSENGQLMIANGVWVNKAGGVKSSFRAMLQALYGAQTSSIDFGQPDSNKLVNDWVSKRTGGKITNLFGKFDRGTIMALANCVYFKDQWVDPLVDAGKMDFNIGRGRAAQTTFMSDSDVWYAKTPSFEVCTIPYKSGLAMQLFLPAESKSLKSVLGSKEFAVALGNIDKSKTAHKVYVPNWTTKMDLNLADYWQSKGGQILFSPRKGLFSGINDGETFISQAIHKTFIKVDRLGTEAAAATGIGISLTSAPVQNGPTVYFNRQFIYAIVEPKTGTPLFVGIVSDPRE